MSLCPCVDAVELFLVGRVRMGIRGTVPFSEYKGADELSKTGCQVLRCDGTLSYSKELELSLAQKDV